MKASVRQAFAELRALKDGVLSKPLSAAFAEDPQRFAKFQARLDDLLFDFSKQRVFDDVLAALLNLAHVAEVEARRDAMFAGGIVNPTE
jgi:glucose-6-phosphate isomerase